VEQPANVEQEESQPDDSNLEHADPNEEQPGENEQPAEYDQHQEGNDTGEAEVSEEPADDEVVGDD
jgi:hypothetical protein